MELDRCEDLRSFYPAFVRGELDPSTTLRIQKHLGDVCASCAAEIEELHSAFQAIPLADGPVPLPEGSADALVARLSKQAQEEAETPIVFRESNEGRLAWTLVLLAMAALIAVGFWGRNMDRQLQQADDVRRASEVQTRKVVDDYRVLQQRARAVVQELEQLKAGVRDGPQGPKDQGGEKPDSESSPPADAEVP
ncbi:MAG: hypothetical protein VX498_15740 [Myxococcota bacterium]|nr:hypothetical protein [Myxococcota bacterium]